MEWASLDEKWGSRVADAEEMQPTTLRPQVAVEAGGQGCEDEEREWTRLGLRERCVHRAWKCRRGGYEAAARHFRELAENDGDGDDDDGEAGFACWTVSTPTPSDSTAAGPSLLTRMLTDVNVVAHEAGVRAVLAFVRHCPDARLPQRYARPACLPPRRCSHTRRHRAALLPALVERGLASTRQETRRSARDTLQELVALGDAEVVVVGLLRAKEETLAHPDARA